MSGILKLRRIGSSEDCCSEGVTSSCSTTSPLPAAPLGMGTTTKISTSPVSLLATVAEEKGSKVVSVDLLTLVRIR